MPNERVAAVPVPFSAKRVYRVMRTHGLLMQRRPIAPQPQRRHDGKVAVARSNQQCCSDCFECRCDNGDALDNPGIAAKPRNRIVVEDVQADAFGGARILMSQSYCLSMFPDGTRSEDWRFFSFGKGSNHFVVAGGKVFQPR